MSTAPVHNPDELRAEISARYNVLSKRLKQIARFALEHPNDMALETIAVIAERARVQPSALIRFAKAFGYSGFSDMQRVFQARLVEHSPSYSERIRVFWEKRGGLAQPTSLDVLKEFSAASIVALEHLQEEMPAERLEQAVKLLARGREIHVIGQRRSFPVATYLTYLLSHADRYAHLLDSVGGMLFEQLRALKKEDVLVAISFQTYAPETAEVVARAAEKKVPIISITDSPLSPIAGPATVVFEVHDAEVRSFRALTASMCLVQTLAMNLALQLE